MTKPRETTGAREKELSGVAYVSAKLRGEDERYFRKLPRASVRNCTHETTICPTRECVMGWGEGDWRLLLQRTIYGRKIIATLNLTEEEVDMLGQQDFPFTHLSTGMEIQLTIENPDDLTGMPLYDNTNPSWAKIIEEVLDRLIPGEYPATRTILSTDGEAEFFGTIRIESPTELTWYEHERTD